MIDTSGAVCSPVTEIYNPNATGGAKDWIFFSVGNDANTSASGNPIPSGFPCRSGTGSNAGCVISIDVTDPDMTWPPTSVTNTRAMPGNDAGSTSGIVVDNLADPTIAPEASSIYLTFGSNSTAGSSCNGATGVGCAVKLTQSALQ
jgi:hypothetical protein